MELKKLYDVYAPIVNRIASLSNGTEFRAHFLYIDPNYFSNIEPQYIYRTINAGIVERCQIACLTSILRNLKWIEGTLQSKEINNLLCFSASLRGFLESSADSWDLKQFLPSSLYHLTPYFYATIHCGDIMKNRHVDLEELEKRLIHFSYAKRHDKNKIVLPEHNHKSNAEYIRVMEGSGVNGMGELYSRLCQLTHPAADSLNCFLDIDTTKISININNEKKIIDEILGLYEKTIECMVIYSMNSSFISLSYMSRIFEHIHAPSDQEMSGIGNVSSNLKALDAFILNIKNNQIDWEAFRTNPLKWPSQI